ncbi:polysaccharide deacetylase family protein [Glutamicibacter sp. PS]|uniref:polysaccharide deacetylase family protein n=1 Tax=Glutamicibacter sp. PS TaxID=3075634 RepID=UPI002848EA72|nr:polysaccharide deacetylase family protein [Glutamicibacter sp. PS]MDR4533201.1 polysaccharide deacetylase family protein [Glutamicibacter sp. PS]
MAIAKNVAHVADLKGPKGDVGPAGPREVKVFVSTDNYTTMPDGVYTAVSANAAEAIGMPTKTYGTLVINYGYTGSSGLSSKLIQWMPHDGTGNIWSRTWNAATGWSSRFTTGSKAGGAILLAATNLATLPDGYYTLVSNNAANTHGLPRVSQGDFIQSRGYDSNNRTRIFYPSSYPTEMWVQAESNGIWGAWQQMGGGSGGGSVVGSSVERETRKVEHRARYGGRYGTAGLATLSLVFDHGTDNFIAKVLPILQRYGVPATIGLNSQMYNPDYTFYGTDQNTTFASLQTAFINNGISVWNHGRLHKPASEAPSTEIIGGRDELMASLPKIPIDGWLHTGTYGDFNSGSTFANYRDQSIGSLIMNGHAILTGNIQEPIKDLAGEMKPGFDGEWIDAGATPIASVKSLIQRAQAVGGGVMTRQHPQFIDQSGYITTAQLDEFIGWAAAERDAGRLLIITGDLLNLADSGSSVRRSLIGEVTSGSASLEVIDHPLRKGGVVVLEAEVTGSGTAVMSATGGGINASRSVAVSSAKTITLPFMIPLDATGTISVTVTGVTVSKMRVVAG